jgi:hypothetical protein
VLCSRSVAARGPCLLPVGSGVWFRALLPARRLRFSFKLLLPACFPTQRQGFSLARSLIPPTLQNRFVLRVYSGGNLFSFLPLTAVPPQYSCWDFWLSLGHGSLFTDSASIGSFSVSRQIRQSWHLACFPRPEFFL